MSKRREDQPRLPKQNEMVQGARLALTNSRRHLRVARILGKERLYGAGVAHVVLSLEEHAKAFVLTLAMFGIDVPKQTLREVLTRHDARQGISLVIVAVAAIRFIAVRALEHVQRDHNVTELPTELRAEYIKQLTKRFRFLATKRPKNDPSVMLLDWAFKANDLKNHGLYVDFDGVKWIAPTAVSARQFAVGYEIANRLLREFGTLYSNIKKMKLKATPKLNDIMQKELAQRGRPPEEILSQLINIALGKSSVDFEGAFTIDEL